MPTLTSILSVTPKPAYNDLLLIKNQDTQDIIKELFKSHKLYYAQACTLSDQFKGKNIKETAKKLHTFLQKYSNYNVEDINSQTSKSIHRYVHGSDKETYLSGDCKHQSLFVTAVLKCLYPKAPIYFRFTSYKIFDSEPSHVYSMIVDKRGNEITIDPLQSFNTEKYYYSKIDKKIPNTMLSRLSGVGQTQHIAGVNIVKKVALAIPRNAFLLVLKINPFMWGTKMKQAIEKSPSSVRNWWEKLGGNFSKLSSAVANVRSGTGSAVPNGARSPVGSQARKDYCQDKYSWGWNRQKCLDGKISSIGAVDPATATLIATATPMVIAMTGLFKQLGITLDKKGQDTVDLLADDFTGNGNGDNGNGANGNGNGNGENGNTIIEGVPDVALLGGAGLLALLLLRK